MTYKIIRDMVVVGNYVYAKNIRREGISLVADGIYSEQVDENGNPYRTTEVILTENGDCIEIR